MRGDSDSDVPSPPEDEAGPAAAESFKALSVGLLGSSDIS